MSSTNAGSSLPGAKKHWIAGAGQPVLGQFQPAAEGLVHQLAEQFRHRVRVGAEALHLLGRRLVGVVAGVGDRLAQLGQAVPGDLQVAAVQGGGVHALAAVHDRDDHLAGDVAAHDQGVAAVELAGVEELAQAYLGAVDVGGEVDLAVSHAGFLPLPRGARTRAHAARSARAPSSAVTSTASSIARRMACAAFGDGYARSGSASASCAKAVSLARLSLSVVYQPQSAVVTAHRRSSEIVGPGRPPRPGRAGARAAAGPRRPGPWC